MGSSVVVSDIDGTVVFSGVPAGGLVSVESYSSGRHGQMTQPAYDGWERLAKTGRLVVATTRTREQFLRLALPAPVRLAMVSNGYRVLVDGIEDARWNQQVRRLLDSSAAAPDDVLPLIHAFAAEIDGLRSVTSDDVLVTLVADDVGILPAAQARIAVELAGTRWQVARSGRKMYVLPAVLDKGALVAELLTEHGFGVYMGGGDSLMDATLVTGGKRGVIPLDSDLAAEIDDGRVLVTDRSGVEAGAEVVAAYEAFLGL